MKPISLSGVITFVIAFLLTASTQAQSFGTTASAVWLTDCNQSNYFNTTGSGTGLIGPSANVFTNANLGAHTRNSGSLILRGGEVRTSKTPGAANVCSVNMYYRVYLTTGIPGAFNSITLPLAENCDVPSSEFPSGGSCVAGDQKWNRVIANGQTTPYAPVNLTSYAPGNYTLEVYYDVTGSSTSTTLCDETNVVNNSGNNYKATFSIQAPILTSTNPTTCNGTEGSIVISGLIPGLTYVVNYTDDGSAVGPNNYIANAAGEISVIGLNAGLYTDFELLVNGCTTLLNTGLILSNPVITPTFAAIPAFCSGTTPPTLPTTSLNGLAGTWSPSVVSNTASGSYVFTPAAGQCGHSITRNITVTPRTTPTFTFGTSRTICTGGAVPVLPNTSTNGISGTWSPAVVDNNNSGTYVFTPTSPGVCANNASFTVTVTPNVPPTFTFGNTLTICAGAGVPALPTTSNNGFSGTWSPATIDNQNSGTYTFTPNVGQCALPATLDVTVNPNAIPVFSFGPSLTICPNGAVPTLPNTSDNGINGTWSPAVVSNTNSGTYTFTPSGGICALPYTYTVTVTPNVTPTFTYGTSLTICAGGAVPFLVNTSTNGITGTWNPAIADNNASGTYTFTPDAGQCAVPATFTVNVTPNVAPTFSFGTTLTICAGQAVPALVTTSTNGITGTWSPAVVDNNNSAVYTFTPSAGVCATPTTFTVTVNPNVIPTFSFGPSLTVCSGGSVPSLPASSDNGVNGTWSPATVSNTNSGTYTFTPAAGICALPYTFTVTVAANITPAFSYGTSLTICSGAAVPALVNTSTNGITGTWSPAIIDNTASGSYTFTPDAGQCALPATFTVTVNPNITPTFTFGTSLTVCAGATVPALPGTSSNGINGTWSPATVDNNNSGTYTFTPAAGICALPATFDVTVNPNVVPAFAFGTSLNICDGGSVPSLPNTSTNGITGTWSPATVDNNNSGTYTFTPTAGLCATPITFTVTVAPNITPVFSYGTSLTICAGGTVPALVNTSTNGITGTWSPAIVDNTTSGTYTFTPDAGLCALPASFTVTVNPILTPAFSFGTTLSLCAGATVTALPGTSTNGVTGTWSPAIVDNQNSGTYTFTPTAGECAVPTTFTVNVNSNTTPTFSFGTVLTICANGSVPALPTTSTNGIAGTWSPAIVSDQNSGTYTFTPSAGQCALTATFTVTVNPNILPTFSFGTSLTICQDGTVPLLPNTSDNGITGTWSPAVVDNQASAVYTFTPDAGICATTTTFTVTVNSNEDPTFSFGPSLTICAGANVPVLPGVSLNGLNGTWSPAIVDNQASGVYTFTPTAGQCATATTTFTVTVNPNITPVFSIGSSLTICAGEAVPFLDAISDNGISGTWSPAIVSDQNSGVYTFTPDAGVCATVITFTVTVNPIVTPSFAFGTSLTICNNAVAPVLPNNSDNGITGTWSPSIVDNQNSGVYTFTPDAGQCTVPVTFTVTVNPNVAPAFSFAPTLTICAGGTVPVLSTTSDNGVTGTWSPAVVDNQASGVYTFTPSAGLCATPTTFTVTVTPNTIPTFGFGTTLNICTGGTVPVLNTTSDNGIDGTWSPAIVDNQASGVYTFTPVVPAGQCIAPTTFTVTVNPILTPTFNLGSLSICEGSTAPVLPTTSVNGITGVWSPAIVSNTTSGTYTFTTNVGQCADPSASINVTVIPRPSISTSTSDTTITDGTVIASNILNGTPSGITYSWTNSNTAIGLGASGTGNIPSFTATNKGGTDIKSIITITPMNNGCAGTARTYEITVKPLIKDIFVPNVFSPNGDGKNDILFVYGNYITKLEMHIFNQWGEQVDMIVNQSKGWDGRHQGKPQPVGVYVYALEATMADGRKVRMKGNITLIR